MKVAIYSRKSKITDQGESIENQISMCKDYAKSYFNITNDILIYKDEGFSGSNIERPMFTQMINDVKTHQFEILICYRIDRISRNIVDFINTYEILQKHNIQFVSIKEQFDTSTPIGRAMLNIAMVFAQLERETIAERIRDNMYELARTGRWLGGQYPTGFQSKLIEYYDGDMNFKKMFTLFPIPEEIEIVELIFEKFLELKSLRQVEAYLLQNNIKTKNNVFFSAATIRDILINPVYSCADEELYHYFKKFNAQLCGSIDDYNGAYGAIAYNRTDQSNNCSILKSINEWIVSIGKHKGIITGAQWVEVQNLLYANNKKSFYTSRGSTYGILSGLIKCGVCGSTMRIKKDKVSKKTGEIMFYYVCSKKELSKRTLCNIKNINGQHMDATLINFVVDFVTKHSIPMRQLKEKDLQIQNVLLLQEKNLERLYTQLKNNTTAIDNLMDQLSSLASPEQNLKQYFINKIQELDASNITIKKQIAQLTNHISTNKNNTSNLKSTLLLAENFSNISLIDLKDIHMWRLIIRSFIDTVIWYENKIEIHLKSKKRNT